MNNPNKPGSNLDPNLKARLLEESKNPYRGLRRAVWIALFGSAALGFFIMFTNLIAGDNVSINDIAIQKSSCSVEELKTINGASVINQCILVDNAMDPIRKVMPNDDVEDVERWIKVAIDNANRMGITNVHDAWQDANIIAAIQNLINKDEMNLRCNGMLGAAHTELLNRFFSNGHLISDLYTIRSVKAFIDGA